MSLHVIHQGSGDPKAPERAKQGPMTMRCGLTGRQTGIQDDEGVGIRMREDRQLMASLEKENRYSGGGMMQITGARAEHRANQQVRGKYR